MRKIVKISVFLIFINCGKNNECQNRLPNRVVNIYIDKNLPDGIAMRNRGFHIVENQGVRGIIIYNSSSGWKAYDLASPHLTINDSLCLKMKKKEDWFLENTCDGALFLLDNGSPYNSISPCPLREYPVFEDSNRIIVTN